MTNTAVVFAGGGLAGIAWEIGFLLGVRDASPAAYDRIIDPATRYVGTSAGSAVASAIASGASLTDLYDGQLAPESAEIAADIDMDAFGASVADAVSRSTSELDRRRLIGQAALAAETVSAADRRVAIAARLPVHSWPDRALLITAVDTETGELRVFDRDSGVDIVDAVSASCAVPGVWPAVEIEGRLYMDGGVRTIANADLAAGSDPILILVPGGPESFGQPTIPTTELSALQPSRALSVFADGESIRAFGANPLDPAVRPAGARAGREQGRAAAAQIAEFLG